MGEIMKSRRVHSIRIDEWFFERDQVPGVNRSIAVIDHIQRLNYTYAHLSEYELMFV